MQHWRAAATAAGVSGLLAGFLAAPASAQTAGAGAGNPPEQSFIVTFDSTAVPDTGEAAAPEQLSALAAASERLDRRRGVEEVTPLGGRIAKVDAALTPAQLDALPNVASVEPDRPLELLDEPNEALQWHLENAGLNVAGYTASADADIDARAAWSVSTGAGVVVAVGDTGVQTDHPDLAAHIWSNADETCGDGADNDANGYVDDCRGWDFGVGDANPTAGLNAHGTHVAGIAGALRNSLGGVGVAPDAAIMPLKISDDAGALTLSAAIASIYYAADNGADIYNASWGANSDVTSLRTAVSYATQRGVLFVAAAGNDGRVVSGASAMFPAGYASDNPGVVSVASTDMRDQLSSFSNRGGVTLAAPGSFIHATYPQSAYGYMSGTSMASPVVAGVAALVAAANPSLTPAQIRTRLVSTVDTPAGLSNAGAGRVNAARAVNAGAPPNQPVAPDAPTVAVGSISASGAVVSWTPAAGGGTPTSWQVEVKTGAQTASTATLAATARSHTVSGLKPGVAYTATVTALNGGGAAGASAAFTTLTPPKAPKAPTKLTGAATATQARVEFKAAAATPGVTIAGYEVKLGQSTVALPASGPYRAQFTGLTPDTTYVISVAAIGANGARTTVSGEVRTGAATADPTAALAAGGEALDIAVTPLKAAPGRPAVTGYRVEAGGQRALLGPNGKGTLSGLAANVAATVRVTVLHDGLDGASAVVGTATPRPAAAPDAPAQLQAVRAGAKVAVSWTAPANTLVTEYQVTINGAAPFRVKGDRLTVSLKAPAGPLSVRVTAVNPWGQGAATTTVS